MPTFQLPSNQEAFDKLSGYLNAPYVPVHERRRFEYNRNLIQYFDNAGIDIETVRDGAEMGEDGVIIYSLRGDTPVPPNRRRHLETSVSKS